MARASSTSSSSAKRGTTTTDKMVDADAVKKICDIYDWDGKGELDLFYLGDVMYALGMNTTKKVCVGLGQTDEEGKKFAKFDDIVEKVNAAKGTPDSSGTYHDYVELLKLYDKNSNGTMMLAELENILSILEMKSPRKMSRSFSLSSLTLKMKMDSSPTCHLSTGLLARPKFSFKHSFPDTPISDLWISLVIFAVISKQIL